MIYYKIDEDNIFGKYVEIGINNNTFMHFIWCEMTYSIYPIYNSEKIFGEKLFMFFMIHIKDLKTALLYYKHPIVQKLLLDVWKYRINELKYQPIIEIKCL